MKTKNLEKYFNSFGKQVVNRAKGILNNLHPVAIPFFRVSPAKYVVSVIVSSKQLG